jgi:hypothetical protein
LLLGGSGKFDYLAKTLSSVALSMDRISGEFKIDLTAIQKQIEVQDAKSIENRIVTDDEKVDAIEYKSWCTCRIS